MISQLTIFLENEKGRLAAACRVIADKNINMHALFLADTEDFGVARIFCDTPEKAATLLKEAGFRATLTHVVGVRVPNKPGGLASLLEFFDANNVNIEYGYCFSAQNSMAIDVLKIGDTYGIEDKIEQAGFEVVKPEDIYELD